jgi:hypothetical protein
VSFDQTHPSDVESVNALFGESVIVERPLVFSNASELVGPKEGTIEFFISPMFDTWESHGRKRQILDITNKQETELTSTTSSQVILPFRVRSVEKVYLFGDPEKENVLGGFALQRDMRTISLGNALPRQRTNVVVQYTPSSSSGDRMEIWIDGYTTLNFAVTAGDKSMQVAREINWKRNTWHRIMCTWDIGNPETNDRIRMFVDGTEENVVTWGSGLVWGDGTVWGQGSTSSEPILGDLPPFEVFGQAVFGADFSGDFSYPFRLDNCRFSAAVREPITVGAREYDLVWNDNTDAIAPVINDALTKGLYDFDVEERKTTSISNLLLRDSPLYSIGIEIDDGFSKLSNERVREALLNIYQRTKPAHMRLYASIKQDTQ